MTQDVNKILDALNNEWANDMANAKEKMAEVIAENDRWKKGTDNGVILYGTLANVNRKRPPNVGRYFVLQKLQS